MTHAAGRGVVFHLLSEIGPFSVDHPSTSPNEVNSTVAAPGTLNPFFTY